MSSPEDTEDGILQSTVLSAEDTEDTMSSPEDSMSSPEDTEDGIQQSLY